MMKKIATIAALAMIAPQVMGACEATDNWIADSISITSVGDISATPATNAVFTHDATWAACASLTAGGSCCTKTDVALFQTKATALVETLKTAVSTRDQYILDQRGDVLTVKDALTSIENNVGSISAAQTALIQAFLTGYETAIESFTTDFAALKTGFVTLQTNRQACFNALVKSQATIWCAACTEDITTVGLTDSSTAIAFGTAISTYVANACSAYVASAVEQSTILSLSGVADIIATLSEALDKAVSGDTEGAATLFTEFVADFLAITTPTNDLHKVAYAPATCTTASCAWATGLLSTGELDTDLATVGGFLTVQSRLLQEVEAPAGRMLTLDADPATEVASITVDFPENPGNVDNDQNSAIRNGAIACAITALAALF